MLTGRNNKRSCIDSALPCDHMATEADGCSQGPGLAKTEFTVAKAAAKVGMATMHLGKVRASLTAAERFYFHRCRLMRGCGT